MVEPAAEAGTASNPDTLTLVAIAALAYVIEVAVHEHVGHGSACLIMGSHLKELGAFYSACDDGALSSMGMRVVASAGPAASLLLGIVAFLVLRRVPVSRSLPYYFTWLLGSLGLMSAAGYPVFSGMSGLGDLGMTRDGALFGAAPEVLWRIGLTIVGYFGYMYVVKIMCRAIAPCAGAPALPHLAAARRATLLSYVAGAVVYLAIGAFNPLGWTIILASVLPSSMGGTSGLLWMWPIYRRSITTRGDGEGIHFDRNWTWTGVSIAVIVIYAIFFGPSLRP